MANSVSLRTPEARCYRSRVLAELSMSASQSSRYWRWIFIIVEAMLVVDFALCVFVAPRFGWRGPPEPRGFAAAHGVFVLLAWLFLLIASPFFVRSLRGV